METERQRLIAEKRQQQPMAELERKWAKAQGRYSRHFWMQEWLDLAHARAKILYAKLLASPLDG